MREIKLKNNRVYIDDEEYATYSELLPGTRDFNDNKYDRLSGKEKAKFSSLFRQRVLGYPKRKGDL